MVMPSIIKLILGALVVTILFVGFSRPLIPLIKQTMNIFPEACAASGKTTQGYSELIQQALREEKYIEAERLFLEHAGCNFKEMLDDELHFTTGKAVYSHHLKNYQYKRAPIILEYYVRRTPRPTHYIEAEKLIKEAHELYTQSPAGRIEALTALEATNWQQAKEGYKTLLEELSTKPIAYQHAFSREAARSKERYIRIEADQFRTLNLKYTQSNANQDPRTGSMNYLLAFKGLKTPTGQEASYTLGVSTTQRSVQRPFEPLQLQLSYLTTNRPMTPPAHPLDIEANIHTATTLLERLSIIACRDSNLQCAYAPLQTSTSEAAGLTLVPPPPPQSISGPALTFTTIPYLPTTTDTRSTQRYPQFEAIAGGKPYQMSITINPYPTPHAQITWQDHTKGIVTEPQSMTLTRAALQTLCPTYQPPPPLARDMTGELTRCLASRQIFATPYQLRLPPLQSLNTIPEPETSNTNAPGMEKLTLPSPRIKPSEPLPPPPTPTPQPKPDLIINSVQLEHPPQGIFAVHVANKGTAPASDITVQLFLDGWAGRWHHTITLDQTLSAEKTIRISIPMPKPPTVTPSREWECISSRAPFAPDCSRIPPGTYEVIAVVDPDNQIDELQNSNNEHHSTIDTTTEANANAGPASQAISD